jgi:regulator of nucleoside diphosphate kinase
MDRAELCPASTLPPDVVTIGSRVRYRDPRTRRENAVVLTWPGEADLAAGKVSVLSPIGAALIGLTVGQSIGWSIEHGELRSLAVLEVGPA